MSPLPPTKKQRRLDALPPPPIAERLRGALSGLWLGDAMGMPMLSRHFHVPDFPALYEKPLETARPPPLLHKHSLALGFASCVAYSLLNARQFNLKNLLQAYGRHASFLTNTQKLAPLASSSSLEEAPSAPLEVSPSEADALPSLEPGLAWSIEHSPRFHSASTFVEQALQLAPLLPVSDNVLLRCLPLACFFYADAPMRIRAVAEEAVVTRAGPEGAMAAVALSALLAASINSVQPQASVAELLEAVHRDMADAAPVLTKMGTGPAAPVLQACNRLKEDIEYAQKDNPNLYGPTLNLRQHRGQLRTSFRLALWEFFHAPEGNEACVIEDVIRRGGTPSSQGALVAALCGGRWGRGCLPSAPHSLSPAQSCGDISFLGALAESMVVKLS